MKSTLISAIVLVLLTTSEIKAQSALSASVKQYDQFAADGDDDQTKDGKQQIVLVTGVRFSYPIVQKWIDDFNKEYPDIQVIIESRGTSDPAHYDVLVEAYDPDKSITQNRIFAYVARYAVLPVANSNSEFAKVYGEKGLTKELINQVYFHDLYSTEESKIKVPYTVYTRLQKAGAPTIFAQYFGYEQKDVKGKAIAGSDEHLLKAILRDSTAVSFLPLSLIYYHKDNTPVLGLTVIPVDFDGNGRVSDDEKFYGSLENVITRLEETPSKDINNLPIEYLNLSIDKNAPNPYAVEFLTWVLRNEENSIHKFGYLSPDADKNSNQSFLTFASKFKK